MEITFEGLVKVARELLAKDGRHVLGLTGKPGSGKSTLAAQLVAALGEEAVAVPMDGFHLANRVLGERGLRERKGCVESFDASGYANLLQRICAAGACDIFFPVFHREVEESYAAEGAVTPKHRLVVTDGIWLLHASFSDAQKCLDASVYVEQVPDDKRIQRLIERRMQLAGEERAVATRWATGPDESNAKLVAETRSKAQYILV